MRKTSDYTQKNYPQKQQIILEDNRTQGGNRTHTSEETGF